MQIGSAAGFFVVQNSSLGFSSFQKQFKIEKPCAAAKLLSN